jgi:hypothetical protein
VWPKPTDNKLFGQGKSEQQKQGSLRWRRWAGRSEASTRKKEKRIADTLGRNIFESAYAEQRAIEGVPQAPYRIYQARFLEADCFSLSGGDPTFIDFLEVPIQGPNRKAEGWGLTSPGRGFWCLFYIPNYISGLH